MPNRRNVLVGLGAMALGSGVVLGAGASGASAQPSADLRVIAAAELVLSRGDGWDDSRSDMSESSIYEDDFTGSPSDLPVAYVDDEENDELTLEIAKQNEASQHTWEDLIQVENSGTSDVDIRIDYAEYGEDIAETYGESDLDREDAQEIFQFHDSDGTLLSPVSDSDEGANILTVAAGAIEQITLVTDMTSEQVSAVNDATTVTDPWQSGGDTGGVQFLREIEIVSV